MAYVSSTSAAADNVALPSFSGGDVAFVLAFNASNTTIPSLPAGWTSVRTAQSASTAGQLGWKVLVDGDTSTGAWTNANQVGVAVYSGLFGYEPIDVSSGALAGGALVAGGPASSANTQLNKAVYSTSVSVSMILVATSTVTAAPSGWTNRAGTGTRLGVADISTYSGQSWTFAESSNFLIGNFALRIQNGYAQILDQYTTSGTVTSNSTSWSLTYPSGITNGDLLVACVASDGNNTTTTWPSGWRVHQQTGNANVTALVAFKTTDGTESGNFTMTSASEQGAWRVFRIANGTWANVDFPTGGATMIANRPGWVLNGGNGSGGSSTSASPQNALQINPAVWAWEGVPCAVIEMIAIDTSRDITGYPQTAFQISQVSGGAGGATLGTCGVFETSTFANSLPLVAGQWTYSATDDVAIAVAVMRAATPQTGTPKINIARQLLAQ